MGFFSSLKGAVSSVCSAISSACSACASFLRPAVEIGLRIVGPILRAVTTLLIDLCKLIGIDVVNEEDVKDGKLGIMIEDTADSIKPEDYKTTAEYIKAVKEKVNTAAVDAKMETLSAEEKEAYKLVSASVLNKIASEKMGVEPDFEFYTRVTEMGLNCEQTKTMIDTFKKHGIENLADVSSYFNGTLDDAKMDKVDEAIKDGLSNIDPTLQTDEQKENALAGRLRQMEETMKEEGN